MGGRPGMLGIVLLWRARLAFPRQGPDRVRRRREVSCHDRDKRNTRIPDTATEITVSPCDPWDMLSVLLRDAILTSKTTFLATLQHKPTSERVPDTLPSEAFMYVASHLYYSDTQTLIGVDSEVVRRATEAKRKVHVSFVGVETLEKTRVTAPIYVLRDGILHKVDDLETLPDSPYMKDFYTEFDDSSSYYAMYERVHCIAWMGDARDVA